MILDVYHDDVSSCNTPLSFDGHNNDDNVTESTPNRITLSFNNTFNFTCDDLQDNIDAEDSDGEGVTNENYFHDLYLQYIRDSKENEKKKLETQLSQIRASKHEEHCKNKESAFLQYENNSNGKFVIDRGIEISSIGNDAGNSPPEDKRRPNTTLIVGDSILNGLIENRLSKTKYPVKVREYVLCRWKMDKR